jgi:peptidyl-prolyl cis-trans isomerase B (cyclophilin B)
MIKSTGLKRIVSLALMLVTAFTLSACQARPSASPAPSAANTEDTINAQPSAEPSQTGENSSTASPTQNGSTNTAAPSTGAEEQQGGNKVQNPQVTIEMENGSKIVLELYPDKASNTVNNFIALAKDGFYDGVIFHRVIPGFMIQGGDPEGTGMGGPGYTIEGEFANNGHTENDISHERGVISMARKGNPYNPKSAYNTAGSQFFIMVDTADYLDKDYAAFGKVIKGMEVVDQIVAVKTDKNDKPIEPQKIKKVTVDTFGVDYPEPVTIAEGK